MVWMGEIWVSRLRGRGSVHGGSRIGVNGSGLGSRVWG